MYKDIIYYVDDVTNHWCQFSGMHEAAIDR